MQSESTGKPKAAHKRAMRWMLLGAALTRTSAFIFKMSCLYKMSEVWQILRLLHCQQVAYTSTRFLSERIPTPWIISTPTTPKVPSKALHVAHSQGWRQLPQCLICSQNYLIGCVHLGTDGIHSCPLLQTPGFLLLCSVGLPLDTGNKEGMNGGMCWDGSRHAQQKRGDRATEEMDNVVERRIERRHETW